MRGLRNWGTNPLQRRLKTSLQAEVVGSEHLLSCFAMSDLLSASVAAVGSAASALVAMLGFAPFPPPVCVDQRLVSLCRPSRQPRQGSEEDSDRSGRTRQG